MAYSVPRRLLTPLMRMVLLPWPLDPRAAGDEEIGQVHHFGLAGRVFQRGLAVGQHGGHEQVLRAAHGGHVEGDVGAAQPVAMAHDVAFFQLEGGAHELQALQVLVHRTRADGAAAGQGHAGLADAGQQRAQAEHRGPHGAHQIIGGLGQQAAGRQLHAVPAVAAGAAQHVQELDGGMDVAQVGHVGVDQGRVQQDAGKKNGQGGILGAADIYGPFERRTAFDNELVHQDPRAACGPGPRRMLGLRHSPVPAGDGPWSGKTGVLSRYGMLVFF